MAESLIIDELNILSDWLAEGRKVAMATVVKTWGSSPRGVGSHLIIDDQGNFQGSVSGGCIESAVISEALNVVSGIKPILMDFGVSDEEAWDVGLSCGGSIQVYIESVS
tara:strand:+ start:464 stop:790 length:327 start_codon:yes stop_codon:yes gene_type:complete